MNKKRRTLLLVAVLLLAAVILSGCGVPSGNIDRNDPQGLWNVIVYGLANILVLLNEFLVKLGFGANSWGWAIIIFTVLIKIVTLPLTLKQLQSTKAQQQMQPKMRELQEKYGKDRQKLAEEQMKLYKEAGVNPMGGCLPLLIQLPILWGLYQALYVLANPNTKPPTGFPGSPFFWIPDLSLPALAAPGQTPQQLPPGCEANCVPMVGTEWLGAAFQQQQWGILIAYMSLPILMLLTQMLVQKMAQPPKSSGAQDPQAKMMNQMMFFMPIMFAWITLGLPSGLTLYWTVSNLLAVIQQYFVTGWGGLADWLPFLHARQPAWAGATSGGASSSGAAPRSAGVTPARSSGNGSSGGSHTASGATTSGSASERAAMAGRPADEAPEKPVKRKNRRRR
ncbi:MAG: YidC/Oxa1 family membrane protein insertase [Nitrososphaerales archaeon]